MKLARLLLSQTAAVNFQHFQPFERFECSLKPLPVHVDFREVQLFQPMWNLAEFNLFPNRPVEVYAFKLEPGEMWQAAWRHTEGM